MNEVVRDATGTAWVLCADVRWFIRPLAGAPVALGGGTVNQRVLQQKWRSIDGEIEWRDVPEILAEGVQ